jgi:hypothetical protein
MRLLASGGRKAAGDSVSISKSMMKSKYRSLAILGSMCGVCVAATRSTAQDSNAPTVDFLRDIQSILPHVLSWRQWD